MQRNPVNPIQIRHRVISYSVKTQKKRGTAKRYWVDWIGVSEWVSEWVEFNAPPDTISAISEAEVG